MKFFLSIQLFFFNACILSGIRLNAQLPEQDSAVYKASVTHALAVYHQLLQPETNLYSGLQYVPYDYNIKEGHPYFDTTSFTEGSVVYNGVLYEKLPMIYDLVKEKLVINDAFNIYKFQLFSEKIIRFNLLNHTFIRLVEDSSNRAVINTGFYDLLYDGNTALLKQKNKNIQEDVNNTAGVKRYIVETNSFYLRKGGKYYSVSHKKALLEVLKDRKKEVNQYIRKNKLDMRRDKDNAFTKVVAYYNELTK